MVLDTVRTSIPHFAVGMNGFSPKDGGSLRVEAIPSGDNGNSRRAGTKIATRQGVRRKHQRRAHATRRGRYTDLAAAGRDITREVARR